jgi:hypothetical protein
LNFTITKQLIAAPRVKQLVTDLGEGRQRSDAVRARPIGGAAHLAEMGGNLGRFLSLNILKIWLDFGQNLF